MRFTRQEVEDLLIAWVVLSIALSILWWGYDRPFLALKMLPRSLIAVGTGFALHELAHKYTAQRYGLPAEFRRWNIGLLLALGSSFFGILFAAPGAVHIFGYTDEKTAAKTSISGPVANLAVAITALSLSVVLQDIDNFLHFLVYFNLFLALFNLLPFPPLDGSKVLKYNPVWWGAVFFPILGLLFYIF